VTRTDLDVYARAVVQRRVPAGVYHRLACVRHLRDRARARRRDPAFPYVFEMARAERFFRFAAQLRHYQGEWAGRHIVLEPHQRFRLGSLFAWVQRETRLRRFRTAYNEIPRKNGKSLEAAIVSLYVTFFDQEPGAEGYVIATKREQAKIVWNDAKRLSESSGLGGPARLQRRLTILAANLHRDVYAQKLEPLGADKDSTDGLNPHLIVVDEFHAHKDRGLIDVMETATGARRQPLNFQITTAGNDPLSPCGDQHDYACQILDEVLVDETFFAFIASADPDDDPWAEATWRKANPNYGVSVKRDDLQALATKAVAMTRAAATFKQKRLNLWVNATTGWLSLDGWRRGQTTWTADSLAGLTCFIGVDLSSKIDLSAVVLLFPPTEDCGRWRVVAHCLTPEKTLEERARRDRAPYLQWVASGVLTTNPGNRIDQKILQQWVRDAAHLYDVQGVGVDQWNAAALVTDLQVDGLLVVEIPQNTAQLSAPAKDFEADVLDGLVDAGGNPLLEWCVSNVTVTRDNNDNIFPVKKRSRGRIDPVIAAVLARKLATTPTDDTADDPELVVA
jgi:phage terminase large subunit-like protein